MKKVIQRALPLNVKYKINGVFYQSIEDGGGCPCDNCGKLITNIATIKNETGGVYSIGLDCLESILINNNLLDNESYLAYQYSDKPAIAKAKSTRAKIINRHKENENFVAEFVEFDGGKYGFSYYIKNGQVIGDKVFDKQLGFDYAFSLEHRQITLNYLRGLPSVIGL